MAVIVSAGHVDHGKSTLIEALTGAPQDRLAEERRRGLTIELGFAFGDDGDLEFIDAPGHHRFVPTMLAGAGAASVAMLVVAATEGWKPQTEEHLRILDLLGVPHGLIALTFVDKATPGQIDATRAQIAAATRGTFLQGCDVLHVVAPDGTGVGELRASLISLAGRVDPRSRPARLRMWVDRSFTIHGSGTVVTGTLTGAHAHAGSTMRLVSTTGTVSAAAVRVRGLHTNHRSVAVVEPDHRCAMNLSGASHHSIGRGDVVIEPDRWHLTSTFDASLTVLAALPHPIGRRGAYAMYVGSAELSARVRVLGGDHIQPGASGAIRVSIDGQLPLVRGDRFILRDVGRDITVGGGAVLDVAPVLKAAIARPDESNDRIIAEHGWIHRSTLEMLIGETVAPTVGEWVVDRARLEDDRNDLMQRVDASGPTGVSLEGLSQHERALIDTGIADASLPIELRHGMVRRKVGQIERDVHPFIQALIDAPFAPPAPPHDLDRSVLIAARADNIATQIDGIWFATDAIDATVQILRALLAETPEGFTVSSARQAMRTSRKFALALLGHLDAAGITTRDGDLRRPGNRWPSDSGNY